MMRVLLTLISIVCIFKLNADNSIYKISEGDTLYSIAKKYNISINELYEANEILGFSPELIIPGNTIYIPKPLDLSFHDLCFSKLSAIQMHTNKV